jgi:hypothetical protein
MGVINIGKRKKISKSLTFKGLFGLLMSDKTSVQPFVLLVQLMNALDNLSFAFEQRRSGLLDYLLRGSLKIEEFFRRLIQMIS